MFYDVSLKMNDSSYTTTMFSKVDIFRFLEKIAKSLNLEMEKKMEIGFYLMFV